MTQSGSIDVRAEFERLLPLSGELRREALSRLHHLDPDQAEEIEALLRHADTRDAILDRAPAGIDSPGAGSVSERGQLPPGTQVGRFRIERCIGWGGMGVVYEAEQEFPRRRVALKLIRAELVTRGLIRRFQHEAAVLALLQHPGIAQVFEAGTARVLGAERPFMAMELVQGRTLLSHADAAALSPEQRAGLVACICDAVQHAHQRGVIHRDLKPANIVVVEDGSAIGLPKVLDFGVARLTDRTSAGVTMATGAGQIVGTLEYMSPEQAAGDGAIVDTRTDIYALGAILYELLCGQPPLKLAGRGVADAVRTITTAQPVLPSRLRPGLKGDLETIILHALEKDPSRRYQNASDLAGDLRRFLRREPILARPPSTLYQLATFARRNRALVVAAAAGVVAVMVGVTGLAVGLIQARAADSMSRDQARIAAEQARNAETQATFAREQAERSNRIARYMRSILSIEPADLAGQDKAALKIMLDGAAVKAESLKADPAVHGSALSVVGNAYLNFGFPAKATEILERAVPLLQSSLGESHADTIYAIDALAAAYASELEFVRAEPLIRRSIELHRTYEPNDVARLVVPMQNLAVCLGYLKRTEEGRQVAGELRTLLLSTPNTDPADIVRSTSMMANFERDVKHFAAARTLMDECDSLIEQHHLQRTLAGIGVYQDRGVLEITAGRPRAAIAYLEKGLAVSCDVLGPDHTVSVDFDISLSRAYQEMGDFEAAVPYLRRVLASSAQTHSSDYANLVGLRANLARCYKAMGQNVEGLQESQFALDLARDIQIAPGVLGQVLLHHAESLRLVGRYADERQCLEEAFIECSKPDIREYTRAASAADLLAENCSAAGDLDEADEWRALAERFADLAEDEAAEASSRDGA